MCVFSMDTPTTILKQRQALAKKAAVRNPISRLVESGQAIGHPVTFNPVPTSTFVWKAVWGDVVVKGEGKTKKEAKMKAAENLIEHIEGDVQDESSLKTKDMDDILLKSKDGDDISHIVRKGQDLHHALPPIDNGKATWPACINLLYDDLDSVKSLAIFAFNTNTGMPKYMVVKVIKDMPKKYIVRCTWNMFFLEGEGASRGDAEQEAAHKMMNKVRGVCGMKELEKKIIGGDDVGDSSPDVNDNTPGDLTDRMRGVMVKHSSLLVDPTLRGVVKLLETFSSKVNSPSPIYSIVEDSTPRNSPPIVEVTCKWISLSTKGKGSSKLMAEQKAALSMIKKINECVKQKENSDSSNDEPVQYLVYPSHGYVRGQNNVTVSSRDYLCLEPEQFLNDVIIDFYLKYLQVGLFSNNPLMFKTYTFSIYFYNRLTMNTNSKKDISRADIMHGNVKKWTKSVNIFEKDFIVVPINDCDHWFVIIICYPGLTCQVKEGDTVMQPLMLVLDSLEDGLKDSVCNDLRSYLTSEWKEKMKTTREFTTSTMPGFCPRILQQSNLTDCGLFLLEYVESFFKKPLTNYTTPIGSLEDWFSMEKVDSKRENIAKLIRDLSTEQHLKNIMKFPDIGFPEELSSTAKKYEAPTSVPPAKPGLAPHITAVNKSTIKINLKSQPVPTTHQKHPIQGEKRKTEMPPGGKKKKLEEKGEGDGEEWWCDY